jgi:hypothetical protein
LFFFFRAEVDFLDVFTAGLDFPPAVLRLAAMRSSGNVLMMINPLAREA